MLRRLAIDIQAANKAREEGQGRGRVSGAEQFLINALASLVLVTVPTAIVYWRNKGKLSVGKSYLRGLLHLFRIMGWLFMVGGALFLPSFVTDLFGLSHWGYPWWSIFIVIACVAFGYGLQRLMRFVLRDEDWNNIFASKDG